MIHPRAPGTSVAVADHYDELDPIYRSLWGEHVHHGLWRSGGETPAEAVIALSDMVGERLGFRAGDRLVDIGCGYGATARRFAARGAVVSGFTLSQAQVDAAPPAANVSLACRDWLDNRLPDAGFDGAYAIESSEHMVDKPRFFAEARRVLRPGAPLVVCAWLACDRPTRWQVDHLLEPICYEGGLPSMGNAAEYRAMAEAAGFATISHVDVSAAVARTWTICAARFVRAMLADRATRATVLRARNRRFALSLPRLIWAYRTGAMRYGVFTFR
ncbi:class I SAM-dependent methyltransferase [Sphingomonas quercus]|uniref:Class I SAM-dependent methyltransferase n=1 Tax=Sphingomonas quercus TaxID=2842451 RepID=A0ABS6BER1_9SPHN|nr:class I SAM-dependent methyltransferase [Sphingomonas quercus]MBU3076798.1 class I SAM-dependent methyltransferase [Sphingomonas quercus]